MADGPVGPLDRRGRDRRGRGLRAAAHDHAARRRRHVGDCGLLLAHEPGRGRRGRADLRRDDRDLDRDGPRSTARSAGSASPTCPRPPRPPPTCPTRASPRSSRADDDRVTMGGQFFPNGPARRRRRLPAHRLVELRLRHRALARTSPPASCPWSTATSWAAPRASPSCAWRSCRAPTCASPTAGTCRASRAPGSYDYDIADVFVPAHRTFPLFTREPYRGGGADLPHGTHADHRRRPRRLGARRGPRACSTTSSELALSKVRMGDLGDARPQGQLPAGTRPPRGDVAGGATAGARRLRRGRGGGRRRRGADPARCAPTCAPPPSTPPTARAGVAQWAHLAAGTTAIREGSRLERAFRDLYTGTQHAFIGEKVAIDAAQVWLGLVDDHRHL